MSTHNPEYWAKRWGVKLLLPCPVEGPASSSEYKGMSRVICPGRNRPKFGGWLLKIWCPQDAVCADPMIGGGGLWLHAPTERIQILYGCEVESGRPEVAGHNVMKAGFGRQKVWISHATALCWRPVENVDLILFSPPFLQNHSSGSTVHQQDMIADKQLHVYQEFGGSTGNLGNAKTEEEFFNGMRHVYVKAFRYLKSDGRLIVVLRNRIYKGEETNTVSRHLALLQAIGWKIVGLHPRFLSRPTGYTAWKFKADPTLPWVQYEWAVVARK